MSYYSGWVGVPSLNSVRCTVTGMNIDTYDDQNNTKCLNKIKLIKLSVEWMKSDDFLYILREKKMCVNARFCPGKCVWFLQFPSESRNSTWMGPLKRVAIVCTQTPSPQDPRVWGQEITIQLFQNLVMLHNIFKGIMNAATWYKYFARRSGIYVLWFISFSKITLCPGYKFGKFALFDFCLPRRHIRFSKF